jgi:hypothetical protein
LIAMAARVLEAGWAQTLPRILPGHENLHWQFEGGTF